MKTTYLFLLFSLLMFCRMEPLSASHLVVGEMSYKHLGNNLYEFTLYYYRDCRPPAQGGGNPAAIFSDDPAFISIYNGQNFFSFDSVFSTEAVVLPEVNLNACENTSGASCINRIKFVMTKFLPPSSNEYTILNARCCMNESIINIAGPGTTGHRFYCKIPPANVGLNNSAVFSPVSNNIYCQGKKYSIDHSAVDIDADSLSYGFALPDAGGGPNDPKPLLIGGSLPNYGSTNYLPPFSVSNPMPGISIDEKTGMITLNSTIQGTFVVNIFCNEWRSGILLNTIKRTFIYVIRNCNFEVVAQMSCDTNLVEATNGNICLANCENKTIQFKNKSTGAIGYHWDFGINGLQNDTSNAFEPIFTYPDTGKFKVILIAYGNTCTDSIIQYVSIYEDVLSADFTYSGQLCTGSSIQFTGAANSLNDTIRYWKWDFVNPELWLIRFDENPAVLFDKAGTYHVTYRAFNSYGCMATAEKSFDISTVHVTAYQDTIVPMQTKVDLYATGADQYFWYKHPSSVVDFSSNNTPSTTVNSYNNAQKAIIYVKGSNIDGCTGTDSVKIIFTQGESFFVPTVFSPNGDNLNDVVKPILSGYKLKYFKIFNRRGQMVFSTTYPDYGWDGKFNGQPLGMDSYYWVASAESEGQGVKIFKGDITLVR
nr:gliding motility-associated C-terminal domain-containing protein [Chitinophagaceae bacterium]